MVAAGGFVVGWPRKLLAVPEHATDAIEAIARADVDHAPVPKTVARSVVSLMAGTSLGPTLGLVMLGGGPAGVATWRNVRHRRGAACRGCPARGPGWAARSRCGSSQAHSAGLASEWSRQSPQSPGSSRG